MRNISLIGLLIGLILFPTLVLADTMPLGPIDYFLSFVLVFLYFISGLIIELIIAWIYLLITKKPKRVLSSVVIANIISFPVPWSILQTLGMLNWLLSLILGEIFAFVFEAYFIYWQNKNILSLKQSFVLSILMNSGSLIIGFLWQILL